MLSIFNPNDPAQKTLTVPEKVFSVCYAPLGFLPIGDPRFWSTIGEEVQELPAGEAEKLAAALVEDPDEAATKVPAAKRKGRPKK